MGKVVGVGGIFLKAKDPKALLSWYAEQFGVPCTDYGTIDFDGPSSMGKTVFCIFPEKSDYFGESGQGAMVNFRVDALDEVLARLEASGAWIDPNRQTYDFGRFAWFRDPEGNRVELWEPVEEEGPK